MQTKDTKFEETAIIIRQEEIADDIYSMWLRTEHGQGTQNGLRPARSGFLQACVPGGCRPGPAPH